MTNPYRYDAPLEGREAFYGRTSELTRIASRIAAERPQSVSVVGPALTGKSSLVNYLFDPQVVAEYVEDSSVYVMPRLRLRYDTPRNPGEFFIRLAGALAWDGIEGMSPSYDGLSDVVRRLMAEERRMVIFLDDFEAVTSNTGFSLDFFSFMRSVANSNDVGYLTTSAAPLQNLCHTQDIEESPFFNIFTTVNLEPFRDAEARRLVTEPAAAAGGAFAPAQVEAILAVAGGHPYLLQATASLAFEAHAAGRPVDRDRLARQVYEATRIYLERMWAELSEPQRQVLVAVSGNRPIERRHQYAVDSLERRGLLRLDAGTPAFVSDLVRLGVAGLGRKRNRFFGALFG